MDGPRGALGAHGSHPRVVDGVEPGGGHHSPGAGLLAAEHTRSQVQDSSFAGGVRTFDVELIPQGPLQQVGLVLIPVHT